MHPLIPQVQCGACYSGAFASSAQVTVMLSITFQEARSLSHIKKSVLIRGWWANHQTDFKSKKHMNRSECQCHTENGQLETRSWESSSNTAAVVQVRDDGGPDSSSGKTSRAGRCQSCLRSKTWWKSGQEAEEGVTKMKPNFLWANGWWWCL